MNSEKLQNLLLSAIDRKGISQRELAKLTGISRSTLNDIVNWKIKKINLDDLYQISNILELNLENLLEACGFKSVIKLLHTDRYAGMSNRELKEKIDEYQKSEMDLLEWDAKKRRQATKISKDLFDIKNKIKWSINDGQKYSNEEQVMDIDKAIESLKFINEKYDYSKLPRK